MVVKIACRATFGDVDYRQLLHLPMQSCNGVSRSEGRGKQDRVANNHQLRVLLVYLFNVICRPDRHPE